MTPADLPQYARPWNDPLGNVWCVVAPPDVEKMELVEVRRRRRHPDSPWELVSLRHITTVNCDLLTGLGRECPPVPTPKREAKAVTVVAVQRQYAVRDDVLYARFAYEHRWELCNGITDKDHILAAAEAFKGAGDYLPGETPDA